MSLTNRVLRLCAVPGISILTVGSHDCLWLHSQMPTVHVRAALHLPFMSPRYPGGPRPPLRIPNQGLGGVPGSQTLLPSGMDPSRQQGHPNMGGPMQRMSGPRGMVPLGPQSYGGGMRPPLNALGGPGMPGMNMGPGGGRPWPNPGNANSVRIPIILLNIDSPSAGFNLLLIPYSSASPGNYVGPPGGGGPPGTPIMPSPADSTNSGDNMYTLMNAVPPGASRPNVQGTWTVFPSNKLKAQWFRNTTRQELNKI
ncbi:hypothetical protein AB205_0195130, partial [Aquarana catesbeiana]